MHVLEHMVERWHNLSKLLIHNLSIVNTSMCIMDSYYRHRANVQNIPAVAEQLQVSTIISHQASEVSDCSG